MNYIDAYNKITLNRKDLPKETYGEVHHIWPKSLGGENKPENMVRLTAKEHYIAHHLLTKIFPDCREMIIAFSLMCGRIGAKGVYVSPRVYAEARENFSKAQSEAMSGEGNPNYNKTPSRTTRVRLSEARKGKRCGSNHPMFGRTGENHPRYDSTEYVFQHPEHGERICTQYELWTEFGLNRGSLSQLVHGPLRTHKGWRCLR